MFFHLMHLDPNFEICLLAPLKSAFKYSQVCHPKQPQTCLNHHSTLTLPKSRNSNAKWHNKTRKKPKKIKLGNFLGLHHIQFLSHGLFQITPRPLTTKNNKLNISRNMDIKIEKIIKILNANNKK
jgi:hypothetical protein